MPKCTPLSVISPVLMTPLVVILVSGLLCSYALVAKGVGGEEDEFPTRHIIGHPSNIKNPNLGTGS